MHGMTHIHAFFICVHLLMPSLHSNGITVLFAQCRFLILPTEGVYLPSLTSLDISRSCVSDFDLAAFLPQLPPSTLLRLSAHGCKNVRHELLPAPSPPASASAPEILASPTAGLLALAALQYADFSFTKADPHFVIHLLAATPSLTELVLESCYELANVTSLTFTHPRLKVRAYVPAVNI